MTNHSGLKIIYCLKRLSHLTPSEFSRHWREVHAPLVEQHRSVLRILRYVQSHADQGGLSERLRVFRGSPEPYDGVAEIWYESSAGLGDARPRPGRARRKSGIAGGRTTVCRFSSVADLPYRGTCDHHIAAANGWRHTRATFENVGAGHGSQSHEKAGLDAGRVARAVQAFEVWQSLFAVCRTGTGRPQPKPTCGARQFSV